MKATTLTMDYVPTGNELNMLFDKAYYRSRASYSTFENEVTTITYDTWDSIVCSNFKKSSLEDIASMVFKAAVDAGADFKAALGTAMFVFRCNGGTRDRAYAWTMKLDWVKEPTPATPAQTPAQTPATPAQTPATTELEAASNHAFVQIASFASALSLLQLKKDSKLQAFVNEYRIDAVTAIKQLSKKSNDLNAAAAKKLRILSKALIAAVKSDDINVLIPVINYANATNDDSSTVIITIFETLKNSGYLSESESEEDPKDPDPKDPSDSGAAIDPAEEIFEPIEVANVKSEVRSPLETIATSNGGASVNKKPIPDVEEAYLFNGKEFSDSDLVTILKDKITVLEGRNVSRNSINMLLNLVMNNQDGFVTKLISLGAKIPPEIKEVKATKYTTDKNRFDTVFEVATNTDEPIVVFYHWDPIPNEEGTAWTYDALVLPFDKVTLTKDAKTKKAKADSKRQKKTKKQTENPAPQPQTMTATA